MKKNYNLSEIEKSNIRLLKISKILFFLTIILFTIFLYTIHNHSSVINIINSIKLFFTQVTALMIFYKTKFNAVLYEVNKVFSNREISLFLWITVLFIFILSKDDIRDSLVDVVKIAFDKKLCLLYCFIGFYIIIEIIILKKFQIWDISLLKDTIFWIFFTAIILFFNFTKIEDSKYFKIQIRESIKLIILLEFISNYFVFTLLTELFIVPFITFIAIMDGLLKWKAKDYDKGESMKKFFSGILVLSGLFMFTNVMYSMLFHYQDLLRLEVLKQFLITPILTVMFLPAVYITALVAAYEILFVRIGFKEYMTDEIKKTLKYRAIIFCRFSIKKVNMFSHDTQHLWLSNSKEELIEKFQKYNQR